MLIVTANLKGGVGKTTLAVHLAAWLAEKGASVALIDADMQASSSQWMKEALPTIKVVQLQTPDDVLEEAPKLSEEFGFVVADGPAGMADLSRALLLRATKALVLCGPSTLDFRASSAAVKVVKQAQSIRGGQPSAIFTPNKIQPHTRLSKDLLDAAEGVGIPIARTAIQFRQIYADAPGQGTTVFQMGYRAREAIAELNALFNEVVYGKTKNE